MRTSSRNDYQREYMAKRRADPSFREKEYARCRVLRRQSHIKARRQAWYEENLWRYRAYDAARRSAQPAWANRAVIEAIYEVAEAWRSTGVEVEVDHVIPLRGRFVSGLHVHENLTIVPKTTNRRKRNNFDTLAR